MSEGSQSGAEAPKVHLAGPAADAGLRAALQAARAQAGRPGFIFVDAPALAEARFGPDPAAAEVPSSAVDDPAAIERALAAASGWTRLSGGGGALRDEAALAARIAAFFPDAAFPLDWLRLLTAAELPSLAPESAGAAGRPDAWPSVVSRLLSLDILRQADPEAAPAAPEAALAPIGAPEAEPDGAPAGSAAAFLRRISRRAQAEAERREPKLAALDPVLAQRLRAEHDAEDAEARIDQLVALVFGVSGAFEQSWRADPSALWMLPPLRALVLHLLESRPDSRPLALAAGVAGAAEFVVGALGDAADLFERSHAIFERRLAADPRSDEARRDLSVSLDRLGQLYLRRAQSGDVDRALAAFEQARDIDEALLAADPHNRVAQRDVTISLAKLGDLYRRRGAAGDVERAVAAFERGFALAEQILAADPTSPEAMRDVSIALNRLGYLYLRRGRPGDLEHALKLFERDLRIAENLLAEEPGDAQARRDLSVTLNMLGDAYLRRSGAGDLERAHEMLERSLRIREGLLAGAPGSAEATRDLSIALNNLGDFHLRRAATGDLELALGFFERDLALSEALRAKNPESADASRDVAISLERLGDLYARRGGPGDLENAVSVYERALAVWEGLSSDNPGVADFGRGAVVVHIRLGVVRTIRGEDAHASRHLRACYDILDAFHRAGRPMDEGMRSLHTALEKLFTDPGASATQPEQRRAWLMRFMQMWSGGGRTGRE